jgi:Mrp family chromosome partitioning ATPase
MDLMSESQKQLDGMATASPTPVILPLSTPKKRDRSETTNTKGEGGRRKGERQRHAAIQQFSFPELTEPSNETPAPEAPRVVWPECDVTETVSACAATAGTILRQLSLDRPRMVVFTSPGDGDGKTELLMALAPELAKRTTGGVLVVDANYRKPDLTARLNVPVNSTHARSLLIYPTNLPRLSVLPAPTATKWRSEGFDPSASEELREGWPLVLVDAPSLAHPEVAPMAKRCDGVYLVVRLGHTARRAVAEAAEVIRTSGGRLLGCVTVG